MTLRNARLLAALVAALCAMAFMPAAASACQAVGGSARWEPNNTVTTFHGIDCTTTNSYTYQVRMYVQANDGGWHSVQGPIYAGTTGHDNSWSVNWSCAPFAAAATAVRAKTVIQNLNTGSTDTDVGPETSIPNSC